MEAEGGNERSGANGWDFRDCGVAAGLGSGGAAHWTVSQLLPCLPFSSKLQLPYADVIRATKEKTPIINQMCIGCGIVWTAESYTTRSCPTFRGTAKTDLVNVFFLTRFLTYSGREKFRLRDF
jgi:hypothetical protein